MTNASTDSLSLAAAAPASATPVPPARTRVAVPILVLAVAIGAFAEYVLRAGGPPGAGFALVVAAAVAALGWLTWGPARPGWREGIALLPPLFFASALAWRASGVLTALNLLATLVALALLALFLRTTAVRRARGWDVRRAELRHLVGAVVHSAVHSAVGGFSLALDDLRADPAVATVRWPVLGAALRTALLALPLLLVFGSLLSAADPMFARLVTGSLNFDVADLVGHIGVASALAWMTAGYLRGAVSARRVLVPPPPPRPVAFRSVDVVVALGSLDALFLAFVAVQLRYLFGGEAVVAATTGLTYAEYARRGFFELVAVTALTLPVLLAIRWLLVPGDARANRTYRALSGLLLVLLAGIVLSAARRMLLYQEQFGLTESRLYASAFMVWLVQLLALFALTAWRGPRPGFAFGALVSGWAMLAALDLANPDRLIVRTNVARVREGRPLDAEYLRHLSADAAPAVLAALGFILLSAGLSS